MAKPKRACFWLVVILGAGACDGDAIFRDHTVMLGAPMLYAPTANGISVNAVVAGDREELQLFLREDGEAAWSSVEGLPPGDDIVEWEIGDLRAETRYEYSLIQSDPVRVELFRGGFVTRPEPGTPFTFDLIADSHVFVEGESNATSILPQIAANVLGDLPDFVVHLGDLLDFHTFGFNDPPPDGSWTRKGYLEYRRLLGELLGNTFHFFTIGNWDGENGYYSDVEIERSREQRLLYMPNPEPATYPEGGSGFEDYYAFTWGDALIVVLNVMSYTPVPHLLDGLTGAPDDWTLGAAQLSWLESTLSNSISRWKFICIHHAVGGNGGSIENSIYGRGGGRAAYVGEQARVHALMQQYGVQIFFYGHDHVFTDMQVDGIHYTLPGSCGAPWKFGPENTGYTTYWIDSGHARVHVNPDSLLVEFVDLNGGVLHDYVIK